MVMASGRTGRSEWIQGYTRTLSADGDVIRVRFATDRGTVVQYTAQFEVFVDGRLYPAVRYDSAHGHPHQDILDWNGRVVDKVWLDHPSFGEALTAAVETIKHTWPDLRDAFFRRKP